MVVGKRDWARTRGTGRGKDGSRKSKGRGGGGQCIEREGQGVVRRIELIEKPNPRRKTTKHTNNFHEIRGSSRFQIPAFSNTIFVGDFSDIDTLRRRNPRF